jgi:hypothetical protein
MQSLHGPEGCKVIDAEGGYVTVSGPRGELSLSPRASQRRLRRMSIDRRPLVRSLDLSTRIHM